VSTFDGEQVIDPYEDLIPVCANCHRMLHRRKDDVLSADELKEMILNARKDDM